MHAERLQGRLFGLCLLGHSLAGYASPVKRGGIA